MRRIQLDDEIDRVANGEDVLSKTLGDNGIVRAFRFGERIERVGCERV